MRRVDDFKRSLQSWLYSAWPQAHIRDVVGHSWNAAADGKASFAGHRRQVDGLRETPHDRITILILCWRII